MGVHEPSREKKPSPECNEKESDTTSRDPHEQGILDEQSQIPEFKSSFLGLYRHANTVDMCIVFASTLASIIAGALHPTAPIVNAHLLQYLSRAGIEGEAMSPLIDEFTLYYVYFCIISLVSWTVATAGFIHTGARITRRIKKQYLSAVLRQNMAVFDVMEPGEILSHLTSDTNMIQEALSSKLAITIAAFGNLAGTITVCFALDWILTFILSWSFILGTAVLILGGKATVRFGGRSLDASSAGTAVVEEALGAIKSTTALGMQKQVQRTYVDYLKQASKHGFVLKTLNSSMISICVASGYINVALGFWQGSRRLVDGTTPLPNVVAITLILKSAAFCVLNVGSNLEAFNMAVAAASRVYRMTRRVSPIDSLSNDGVVPSHLDGTIELRNVKLVYPSRPTLDVLENLSVTFPAGKTTAIVGPSGSGKSSIASLILRFYNPVAGALFLDGKDLASFQLRWLRQQIHVVSQEPFLFNKTVYENIALGFTGPEWRTVSPEEKYQLVLKAAKAAQADDFINQLPEGYDTMIGARASRLSGGQAQRIAIARAIVSQHKILVLDEATSALDSETEARVLRSMGENYPKCTRIVIAHRLSTIIDADKIVVVRSGHVIEEGIHNDLMAKQSLYFDLVKAQNLTREVGVDLESDEKHGADLDIAEDIVAVTSNDAKSIVDNDDSILAIDELDKGKQTSSLWSLIKFGWRMNRPEIYWVIVGLLCCALAGIEEPASAILFGAAIVSISQPLSEGDKIRSETGFYSWMFFLLAMAMLLVFGAEGIIFGWCSQKMTDRARKMALEKMLAMDVAFFDKKKNSAGALASFLSTSSNDLAGVSGSALGIILICSSTAISGIVVGMAFGWKLALVCLSLFPLLVSSGYFGVWLVGEFERHIEASNNEAAELASETISGIRTIATMTMEDLAIDQFENILKATTTRSLRTNLQTSFLYALAQAIYYAGMALSFWYGSKLVMRGEYTLNQFVVVQSSMLMSAYSAGMVFSWSPGIGKAKSASSGLQYLLSQKPNIDPSNDAAGTVLDVLNGQIDFDSVTYFYPSRPNRPALKDLSFSISPGSSVAFVGPTGSGKSTVVSMIERFYDPSQGAVRIDGHQLSSLQVAKYRRHIGLVSQDPILYNGTIKMNIMAGLEDEASKPSDADMEEACIQANIYDFIKSLPNGFKTKVGSRGTQLSVGQKQRVALARALIRRPSILILDEATSALDSQSEALIHDALESAKKGRTTITIAHRLSTTLNSDKIFLLNHGSIAEAGTHMELMAKRKMYYSLFTATRSGVDV